MPFVLFLRGFIGVLVVFAIANYLITQSVWTTLVNTVICAVLIQLGYFVAILFVVWRSGAPGKQAEKVSRSEGTSAAAKEGKSAGKAVAPLPGVGRSPLP